MHLGVLLIPFWVRLIGLEVVESLEMTPFSCVERVVIVGSHIVGPVIRFFSHWCLVQHEFDFYPWEKNLNVNNFVRKRGDIIRKVRTRQLLVGRPLLDCTTCRHNVRVLGDADCWSEALIAICDGWRFLHSPAAGSNSSLLQFTGPVVRVGRRRHASQSSFLGSVGLNPSDSVFLAWTQLRGQSRLS